MARQPGTPEHDADRDPASHAAPTRRALLARAAGGFALAAGGLYLPAWREEVAAEKPAHRLGDRNRTRKRKRRNQQNRKKHGKKDRPDAPLNRGIAFVVSNQFAANSQKTFIIRHYKLAARARRQNLPIQPVYDFVREVSLQPQGTASFTAPVTRAFLWIDDHVYIQATNPGIGAPLVRFGRDGAITTNTRGKHFWTPGEVLANQAAPIPPQIIDGVSYRVTPLDEDDNFKRFQVDIGPA